MKSATYIFILLLSSFITGLASANNQQLKYESLEIIGNRVFIKGPEIKIGGAWKKFGVNERNFDSALAACILFDYENYVAATSQYNRDNHDLAYFDAQGGFTTIKRGDLYLVSVTCDLNPN